MASFVPSISTTQLLAVLVGAIWMIAVSRTWQMSLLAFQVHYVALAGLTHQLGSPTMAGLRLLMGTLICLILLLTTYRLGWQRADRAVLPARRRQISEVVFRLAVLGLATIGVFGASVPDVWPSLPPQLVLAALWLVASGLAIIIVSRRALWIGIGVLVVGSGVETLLTAQDPRLLVAGLLAGGGLLLALVVSAIVTLADSQQFQF